MLILTKEQFVAQIPTAAGTDYNSLAPFLRQAESAIKSDTIGKDCFDYIAALEDDDELKDTLLQLICVKAYYSAIPFLDLVQTANGFAVVSNSNQAPASKERVERLIQWCIASIYDATDTLIELVYNSAPALVEWTKFNKFESLTNCLFITAKDYANYCDTFSGNRMDFMKVKSKLVMVQKDELGEELSADYLAELIEANRTNSLTDKNKHVVNMCKMVVASYANDCEEEAEELLCKLVAEIERDIDSYSAYKNSREYALKTSPNYVNKQTDPTFFWGV